MITKVIDEYTLYLGPAFSVAINGDNLYCYLYNNNKRHIITYHRDTTLIKKSTVGVSLYALVNYNEIHTGMMYNTNIYDLYNELMYIVDEHEDAIELFQGCGEVEFHEEYTIMRSKYNIIITDKSGKIYTIRSTYMCSNYSGYHITEMRKSNWGNSLWLVMELNGRRMCPTFKEVSVRCELDGLNESLSAIREMLTILDYVTPKAVLA